MEALKICIFAVAIIAVVPWAGSWLYNQVFQSTAPVRTATQTTTALDDIYKQPKFIVRLWTKGDPYNNVPHHNAYELWPEGTLTAQKARSTNSEDGRWWILPDGRWFQGLDRLTAQTQEAAIAAFESKNNVRVTR